MATIDHAGDRRKELVEPLTSYFVGRLQKDIHSGNTIIGGIFTGVNRENGLNDILHSSAYSAGLDFLQYWRNRTWYLRGNVVFSHVQGSKEAILNTQTSFEHLFQRAGAPEVSVDSNRTSLTGMGGTVRFGKSGGRPGKLGQILRFETGLTFRSPELELNDIGFMLTANEVNHFTWIGAHYQKPFFLFRQARLNYNHWFRWDFSGQFIYHAVNFNSHATFKNNWQAGTGITWNSYDVSNTALRGALSMRRPAALAHNLYVNSDFRKKVFFNLNLFNIWGFDHTIKSNEPSITVNYQPVNALKISLAAAYTHYWRRQDQYVSTVNYNNNMRTIVGEVKQNTLRFTGRLSYNITPDLTLQYYGQPFITRPLYDKFGYVSAPLANKYDNRFQVYSPGQISFANNRYSVDENMDGTTDYSFSKPDFNFVQFRSNLVVRWEYKPGSELYLVWSQGNTPDASADLDRPLANSLFDNAFSNGQARNIFLVKCTYRFVR